MSNIKWVCKTCGAIHDGQDALKIVLAGFFTPVEVVEKPKEEPKVEAPRKPLFERQFAPLEKPVEEEDPEDLRLD